MDALVDREVAFDCVIISRKVEHLPNHELNELQNATKTGERVTVNVWDPIHDIHTPSTIVTVDGRVKLFNEEPVVNVSSC